MTTTCHFVPFWRDNPYQPLLAAALGLESFRVEPRSKLEELVRCAGRDEIVHLHWLPTASLGPRRLLNTFLYVRRLARLKRRGVPIVWTAHNLLPHESILPAMDLWVTRSVGRLATRIICHSFAARDEINSHLRISDPAKVSVIPHGHYIGSYPNVTPPDVCREQLGLGAEDTVFLFLGAIRAYKGVLELVESFRRLSLPNARLVIAGKPYSAELDKQVKTRIGDDSRIVYRPGFVADADMQLYLNAADVVTFPYQKSLTSGALVLAMSYGRASLAPRLPGMVDCLTENGGFFYDTTQPDGLFHALAHAVSQKDQLAAMGARNLERARTWDWQSIARATAACYREATEAAKVDADLGTPIAAP